MRRYRYRSRIYRNWRASSHSKERELIGLIGRNALNMIIERFYKSSPEELSQMLRLYGADYGDSAKRYAQKSMDKWRSGTVKISGQTQDRLVKLVPICLNSSERYLIAKEICLFYTNQRHKKTEFISINTEEPLVGLDQLHAVIKSFYEGESVVELPEKLTTAITWLADDDVTAARALLARVEQEEANLIEARAYHEIEAIEKILTMEEIEHLSQQIEFPNGYIKISTYTPKKPFLKRVLAFIFGD